MGRALLQVQGLAFQPSNDHICSLGHSHVHLHVTFSVCSSVHLIVPLCSRLFDCTCPLNHSGLSGRAHPPPNSCSNTFVGKPLTTSVFSAPVSLARPLTPADLHGPFRKLGKTSLVIKSLAGPQLGQCLPCQAVPKSHPAAFLSWLGKALDWQQMCRGLTGLGPGTANPASCSGPGLSLAPRPPVSTGLALSFLTLQSLHDPEP